MVENDDYQIKKTRYEKSGNGYTAIIDSKNRAHLHEVSKRMEKGTARSLRTYSMGTFYYYVDEKLTE